MKKAFVTIGCSASGKSSYAETLELQGVYRLERDIIRESILASKNPNYKREYENLYRYWNFKWEDEVTRVFNDTLAHLAEHDTDVIISDTNLNKGRRNTLIKTLEDLGYEVEIIVFGRELTLQELWKRDTYRKNTVGHHVVARQYSQFREEFPKYTKKPVVGPADTVIFDIDGTLATMVDRGAFEWAKVGNDEYNHLIFSALKSYADTGCNIILMSGRDEVCRPETEEWFENWFSAYEFCGVPEYKLFMRPQNDMRKDSIIKLELFQKHVDGNFNVLGVFDDRPSVCRDVWMELGFRVYHCANPYLEF